MHSKILTDSADSPYLPKGRKFEMIDPLHWREKLPQLGVFDLVLLHHSLPPVEEKASLLLRSGQAALQQAKEAFPALFNLRYSELDLEALCEAAKENRRYLSRFLTELQGAGQITPEQFQKVVKKYRIEQKSAPSPKPQPDLLFPLVRECLQKHMKKGSKLICSLRPPHSRYEDPQFFEHIITNPSFDYQEQSLPEETLITIEVT